MTSSLGGADRATHTNNDYRCFDIALQENILKPLTSDSVNSRDSIVSSIHRILLDTLRADPRNWPERILRTGF